MLKKINELGRLAQTKIVLVFFSLLFCLIAFAGMHFFDPNSGLPYPSDHMMIITEHKSEMTNEVFYVELNHIAKSEQIIVIKNVLDDHGKISGYVFGDTNKRLFKNKMYTQNELSLKSTTIAGNYFIIGKMTASKWDKFRDQGLVFQKFDTPIWIVAFSFLTGSDLYTISFYILLLMFFVVNYVFLTMKMKTVVIARSFGIYHRYLLKHFLIANLTIFSSMSIFFIIISFVNDYFATVKFKAYLVTVTLFLLLLFILLVLIYSIFLWQVATARISDIQKHKLSGKKIKMFWLFVMGLSALLLTYETIIIYKNYPIFLSQKKLIKQWRPAENYARIWWSFLDNGRIEGHSTEENEKMSLDNMNTKAFTQDISSEDVLIAKLANEQASLFGKVASYKDGKGMEEKTVDASIAKKIYIINPKVLTLNRNIHSENSYPVNTKKAVTVFIPQKYQNKFTEIKFIAMTGLLSIVAEEDIDWKFVPNDQEVFLFMLESETSLSLPNSDRKDMVLIDLDWNKLPKNDRTNFLIGNFTFDALYDTKGLQKKLADHQLIQKVHHFQNVKLSLQSEEIQLNNQFISSILLIHVMVLLQLFIIYDFLNVQVQLHSKQIIIRTINGLGFNWSIFRCFSSLLVTLFFTGLICMFWLGSTIAALSLVLLYFIMMMFVYLLTIYKLKHSKLDILKGGNIN